MCLDIKRFAIRRISLWDIICYKPIKYTWGHDPSGDPTKDMRTPVRGEPIEVGIVYESELQRFTHSVERGLHSYANSEDAINNSYGEPVMKCIIPAGSRFYKGTYKRGVPSYASSKLKYVEFIKK